MAETVSYGNENIKIGTCESLYYTSIQKFAALLESGKIKHDILYPPKNYLNLEYGFMFRFPFPDEDGLRFCEIKGDFNRCIPITVSEAVYDKIIGSTGETKMHHIGIEMQKQVKRRSDGNIILALIVRDGNTGDKYRIEEEKEMKLLIGEIIKNHISTAQNPDEKRFYRKVAARIMNGYKQHNPARIIQNKLEAGVSFETKILKKMDGKLPGGFTQSSKDSSLKSETRSTKTPKNITQKRNKSKGI